VRRPAVAVALLSEAQPPTRDFEHRDPGVDVGHHTCQLEASSRIAAILIRIHGFDPNSPTKLDHNALGGEKFRVCSPKAKLPGNKNPPTKGGLSSEGGGHRFTALGVQRTWAFDNAAFVSSWISWRCPRHIPEAVVLRLPDRVGCTQKNWAALMRPKSREETPEKGRTR
jgi:hypothetical protein